MGRQSSARRGRAYVLGSMAHPIRPTRWQRYGSPALTWAYHHMLELPSRKALAGSLREQVTKASFSAAQKSRLIELLLTHRLLKIRPGVELDPENLEHFNFCGLITESRVHDFMRDFNNDEKALGGLQITFTLGQFGIRVRPAPQAAPVAPLEASPTAKIIGLLNQANRPLTIHEIYQGLAKEGKTIREEALGVEIGRLNGTGALVKTYAEDPIKCRYFLFARKDELTGRAGSVFDYESAADQK